MVTRSLENRRAKLGGNGGGSGGGEVRFPDWKSPFDGADMLLFVAEFWVLLV